MADSVVAPKVISDPDKLIREVLGVKRHDSLPFTGWHRATRNTMATAIFNVLGFRTGAEVGVRIGSFSKILCEAMPGLKLLCVDPWMAYERITQEKQEEIYKQAVKNLAPYNVTFMRMSSLKAAQEIPDGSLDFVYIDGNHVFDSVMLDILMWAPKVRKGGIVSGHDYFQFYRSGVCWAVDAYTHAHCITNWYLTIEKEASWLWVVK